MKLIATFLSFLFISVQAMAHPHVWVYAHADIYPKNGFYDRIHVKWNFDELYSELLLLDIDMNKNNVLDIEEVEQVEREIFNDPTAIMAFINIKAAGMPLNVDALENFNAILNDDQTVTYVFDISLSEPASVYQRTLVGFYDPEYYVELGFANETALTVHGEQGCDGGLIEDIETTIYMGMVHPEVYKFSCEG